MTYKGGTKDEGRDEENQRWALLLALHSILDDITHYSSHHTNAYHLWKTNTHTDIFYFLLHRSYWNVIKSCYLLNMGLLKITLQVPKSILFNFHLPFFSLNQLKRTAYVHWHAKGQAYDSLWLLLYAGRKNWLANERPKLTSLVMYSLLTGVGKMEEKAARL